MEMSSIQSSQVTFKAQPQATAQTKPTVVDKIKNMDDKEKLTAALAGLGALGLGALLYAKGKGHKANEVVGEVVEEVTKPKAQEAVTGIVKVAHETKAEKAVQAITEGTQRGEKAVADYVAGGNYRQIKKEATRNLSKEGKKVAREALSKAHSDKVAAEIAASHNNSANVVESINANKVIENAKQGLRSAVNNEEIEARVSVANNAARSARQAATEASDFAKANPTHHNIKVAKIAENNAIEAELNAKALEEKALGEMMGRGREEAAKARRIAELKATPGYEAGLEKQQANSAKAAQTKVKRQLKNITNKPEYKRTLQEFQRKRYSGEKLMKIMDNPNSSDFEYLAAQELLEKMTK